MSLFSGHCNLITPYYNAQTKAYILNSERSSFKSKMNGASQINQTFFLTKGDGLEGLR